MGTVSTETTNPYLYAGKRQKGTLYLNLRKGKKRRQKRDIGRDTRRIILNKKLIEELPDIVEKCSRLGDFEGEPVVGRNKKGVLVSLTDWHCFIAVEGELS